MSLAGPGHAVRLTVAAALDATAVGSIIGYRFARLTMSKPSKTRRKLSEVRAQYVEAVGGEDVEFEDDHGNLYAFPHPLFADDEWTQAVDAEEGNEAKAKAILGDEQYAKFIEAGNRPIDVALVFMDVATSMQGQLADGRPTRPSTSSANGRKR